MIEEEFNKLIDIVADAFGLSPFELLLKYSHKSSMAKVFLCHIIYHGYPHLKKTFLQRANVSATSFYKGMCHADEAIDDSTEYLCLMNEIRAKVGLQRLKCSVKRSSEPSNTQTMFGFDYSEYDIQRRRNAIKEANEYMRNLCAVGVEPITGCMVKGYRKEHK